METKKDVSYLGKDFSQIRKNLIEFTKQYFPTTYTDFSEASSGMILLELSAYVGDVLSYYADNNLKESLLEQASERGNIYDIANMLGYRPKNSIPAYVTLDVFQLVPSIGSGSNVAPDYTYALSIKPGMQVGANNGSSVFRTLDLCVGFKFRRLDDGKPKYGSPVGQKTHLFNVVATMSATKSIVICEGEFDAIIMDAVCGVPAVGVPGVAAWKPFYPKLFGGFDVVYILGDNDVKDDGTNPGAEFSRRAAFTSSAVSLDGRPPAGTGSGDGEW